MLVVSALHSALHRGDCRSLGRYGPSISVSMYAYWALLEPSCKGACSDFFRLGYESRSGECGYCGGVHSHEAGTTLRGGDSSCGPLLSFVASKSATFKSNSHFYPLFWHDQVCQPGPPALARPWSDKGLSDAATERRSAEHKPWLRSKRQTAS